MKQFDITKATVQECVDYSVQQMVKQGGQSIDQVGGSCMYRSVCGKKHCAIGHLLDKGNEALMTWTGGLVTMPFSKLPSIIQGNMGLFQTLQSFHDRRSSYLRMGLLDELKDLGIDCSGEWFLKWVDMPKKMRR